MPFTIELSPETEARLKEAANAQNVPIDRTALRQIIGTVFFWHGFQCRAKQQ